MERLRFAMFCAVLAAVSSCRRTAELELADTEGRKVQVRCEREGGCHIHGDTNLPSPRLALVSIGRLVGLCEVDDSGKPAAPSACRAIVCESDANCPPSHGLDQGSCLNGVCVEPSHPLTSSDAVMLCLAGTGHGRTTPLQVERYAMALNCGSPCIVPRPCRQL